MKSSLLLAAVVSLSACEVGQVEEDDSGGPDVTADSVHESVQSITTIS